MAVANRYHDIDVHRYAETIWPDGPLPKLTGEEAIKAAKRLWRKTMGKAWPGTWKAGRGNHRTHPRGSEFLVNPGQGWKDIVHDLSHCAYRRLTSDYPWTVRVNGISHDVASRSKRANLECVSNRDSAGRRRHHTDAHAELEREMIRMVLASGWLNGTLKSPAKPKLRVVKAKPIRFSLS